MNTQAMGMFESYWTSLALCRELNKTANMKAASFILGASLVTQMVKNLPALWEIWVSSLGQKDPLKKGMATDSSILAWRIPWTEEPGGLKSLGLQRIGHNWTTWHTYNVGSLKGVLVTKKTKVDTELYVCTSAGAVFSFPFYNNNIYYYCILFLYHLACADLSSPMRDHTSALCTGSMKS